MKKTILIFVGLLVSQLGFASDVKYKGAKDLNFEELLIEGAVKRPELSVVTGDNGEDNNGLLRLRENFLDRMTVEAGEEIPGQVVQ